MARSRTSFQNANATYNALVLEAERRSGKGLEFRVGWTWAKSIDYGQNNGATPRTNAQFDPFTLGYDKGLSTLNVLPQGDGERGVGAVRRHASALVRSGGKRLAGRSTAG